MFRDRHKIRMLRRPIGGDRGVLEPSVRVGAGTGTLRPCECRPRLTETVRLILGRSLSLRARR